MELFCWGTKCILKCVMDLYFSLSAAGPEKSNMKDVLVPYYASTFISVTLCNIICETISEYMAHILMLSLLVE